MFQNHLSLNLKTRHRRIGSRRSQANWGQRLGAAAVETAVVLPIAVMVVFGAIELANGVFLKQSLAVAAYEGARTASSKNATEAEAIARVREVLKNKGIEGANITITPSITAQTPRGTSIQVSVTFDPAKKSYAPIRLLQNRMLEQFAVMVRL